MMGLKSPSEEEILRLVADRESFRQTRRFSESDAIREQLRSMGVELYDKEREWRARDGRRGVLFTAGPIACSLTDEQIQDLLNRREDARTAKDWAQGDALRDELRRQGVELDDRTRSWRTSTGRSGSYSGGPVTQVAGADARGCPLGGDRRCLLADADIALRVALREEARCQKDFERADQIREELRAHGVQLMDTEQKWRTPDGRSGSYAGGVDPSLQQWPTPGATGDLGAQLGALGAFGGQPTDLSGGQLVQAAQDTLAKLQAQAGMPMLTTDQAFSQSVLDPVLAQAQAQELALQYGAAAAAAGPAIALGAGGAASSAPPALGQGALSDASIQALVSGREAVREGSDVQAAESIREDLLLHGVEILDAHKMWRAHDGRQGVIPTLPSPHAAGVSMQSSQISAPFMPMPSPDAVAAAGGGSGAVAGVASTFLMGATGPDVSADLATVMALTGVAPGA